MGHEVGLGCGTVTSLGGPAGWLRTGRGRVSHDDDGWLGFSLVGRWRLGWRLDVRAASGFEVLNIAIVFRTLV